MSFTPAFAPDARSQWGALDFELQELVLDAMEQIAHHPPTTVEHFVDVVHVIGNVRHTLFLRLLVDQPRKQVVAIGVGHVADEL